MKKEITLKEPEVPHAEKVGGTIAIIIGVGLLIAGLLMFITIILILPAIGAGVIGALLIKIGNNAIKGKTKFKCPYCKKELEATSGDESVKCNRCGELILLKWKGKRKNEMS